MRLPWLGSSTPPPSAAMAFEGSQGHATALASHPRGMQGLARVPTPCCHCPSGSVHARALLPAPRGMPGCPRMHATALAACLGCCMHAQALAACLGLGLGCCMPAHGLGCVPWPWPWLLHAWPWPWLRALALAAACTPKPWLPAHGGCLGLGCCTPWPWQHAMGHARMHATPHRPASSRTPAKLARAFFHFIVPKFIP